MRSLASIETAVDTTFAKKAESLDLKKRYKKLMTKIEEGMFEAVLTESKFAPDPKVSLEPTRMTNIRELKKTLPKLEPSPFKLKAKRLQDAEFAQMLEEKVREATILPQTFNVSPCC